ncbi:VacJ family lipoprotein [Novosphingobium sp.]|uniref:MlaA family lipoprotein n=1 Tax=Novosphingobium sp. TaxID=1874826 RepID=UPI00333EE699
MILTTAAIAASIATSAPATALNEPVTVPVMAPAPTVTLALADVSDSDAIGPDASQTAPPSGTVTPSAEPSVLPSAAAPSSATAPAVRAPANGEIVVSGAHNTLKIDPVLALNKTSFAVMEGVDKAFVGPVAHLYRDALPPPVRSGLHNFFYNLTEPVNAINDMLQLHPGRAVRTVARFGINSTIGVAGLVDVAKKKPFNLHYRFNGFGNTFGYWGIGPGPYLFLPLVGPTTLRDLVGTLLSQAVLPGIAPRIFKNYYYVTASGIITQLDYRVTIDDDLNKMRAGGNAYSSYRQLYMKTRFQEIEALHGRGPLAGGEEGIGVFAKPLHPEADAAMPAPTPATPVAAPAPPPPSDASPPVAPPAPVAPLPPVFVSQPVVQPLPAGH